MIKHDYIKAGTLKTFVQISTIEILELDENIYSEYGNALLNSLTPHFIEKLPYHDFKIG
jgi:hypothetical protein